jgi:hypothetical protein
VDTVKWLLSDEERREIFDNEYRYGLLKNTVNKNIGEFVDWIRSAPSKPTIHLEKSGELQLKVSYCDEVYLIDCANVRKVDSKLYAQIEAYRLMRGMGIDSTTPTYSKLNQILYCDGNNICGLVEDKPEDKTVVFFTGLYNFVLWVLSNTFMREDNV